MWNKINYNDPGTLPNDDEEVIIHLPCDCGIFITKNAHWDGNQRLWIAEVKKTSEEFEPDEVDAWMEIPKLD